MAAGRPRRSTTTCARPDGGPPPGTPRRRPGSPCGAWRGCATPRRHAGAAPARTARIARPSAPRRGPAAAARSSPARRRPAPAASRIRRRCARSSARGRGVRSVCSSQSWQIDPDGQAIHSSPARSSSATDVGPSPADARRQRDVGDVVKQRRLGQPVGQRQRRVLPVVDDDDVDVAAHQRADRSCGSCSWNGGELRVSGAQRRQRRRRQAARGGGKRGDGDLAGDAVSRSRRARPRLPRAATARAAWAHEQAAGVGEAHAAAVPLEQRLAGLALELGQLLRHRRGRDVQGLGGGDDRAVGRHGMQGAQAIEVQHASDSKLKSHKN